MIFLKKHLLACASFLCLMGLNMGCEYGNVPEEYHHPVPALSEGEGSWECEQTGLEYTFNVYVVAPWESGGSSIPAGMAYRAYIGETVYYELDENCVCEAQLIRFEFEDLPGANDISVTNANGDELSFVGPYLTGNGEAIHVNYTQLTTDMYIGFDPLVEPIPLRTGSGGYCIVDNISGPKESGLRNLPYEEVHIDSLTMMPYTAVFVPVDGCVLVQ